MWGSGESLFSEVRGGNDLFYDRNCKVQNNVIWIIALQRSGGGEGRRGSEFCIISQQNIPDFNLMGVRREGVKLIFLYVHYNYKREHNTDVEITRCRLFFYANSKSRANISSAIDFPLGRFKHQRDFHYYFITTIQCYRRRQYQYHYYQYHHQFNWWYKYYHQFIGIIISLSSVFSISSSVLSLLSASSPLSIQDNESLSLLQYKDSHLSFSTTNLYYHFCQPISIIPLAQQTALLLFWHGAGISIILSGQEKAAVPFESIVPTIQCDPKHDVKLLNNFPPAS